MKGHRNIFPEIANGYDAALKMHYGDYMKKARGGAAHGYPFFARQKEYMKEHHIDIIQKKRFNKET